MENPELKVGDQPDLKQLREQYESIRHLVVSLLCLTIVVSGTLTLYLMRQSKYSRAEANTLRQMVYEYNNTNFPVIKELRDRLFEYSKTHPDFAPIANRYGINQAAPAPPPASPPVAPAPAPKKGK